MSNFLTNVADIGSWIWAYPLLILIVICGIVYSVRLGFLQFRHFPYIMKQTFGSIFKKSEGEGTVSPFQAAATALACTVGASNIVGVPIAIAFGGPGAVFWMWMCAFIGMIVKFGEIVLGIKYREKNEDGVYVSGPMYYMSKGFPNKKAGKIMAWMMSFTMMLFVPFTISAQSVSAVQSAGTIGINPIVTGAILTVLIGIITFGGIKRIASVTDKMVPIMVILYLIGALIVIGINGTEIPGAFASIFRSAFTGHAALGGFAGAGVSAAIRWGFARGAYSTDLGMGSAAMGHAAATTDHPVRQVFLGRI
ncbi:amino acid carrier protein [Emergencia timonensis]|uniref:alanine/glycine:cation symporter family protein n=1 Tax=Emergencia timonensis TaxID=1776384 RepID=UPI002F3F5D57